MMAYEWLHLIRRVVYRFAYRLDIPADAPDGVTGRNGNFRGYDENGHQLRAISSPNLLDIAPQAQLRGEPSNAQYQSAEAKGHSQCRREHDCPIPHQHILLQLLIAAPVP